jgi:hypothetical protein
VVSGTTILQLKTMYNLLFFSNIFLSSCYISHDQRDKYLSHGKNKLESWIEIKKLEFILIDKRWKISINH